MTDIIRDLDCELLDIRRTADGDGRTVVARVVKYDQPYPVADAQLATWNPGGDHYTEVWKPGAFAKTLAERSRKVKLVMGHDRSQPVGRLARWTDTDTELVIEAEVTRAAAGVDAMLAIEDGVLDGVSLGARPILSRPTDGGVERVEAMLIEVSLTAFPAFDDAAVLAVREEILPPAPPAEPVRTPGRDDLAAFLESIKEPHDARQ
jgi:HK97 family phage prohead protease